LAGFCKGVKAGWALASVNDRVKQGIEKSKRGSSSSGADLSALLSLEKK
jgi:hypothetical protein